jgi:NDP-sugar pyrophosphorylase family protein
MLKAVILAGGRGERLEPLTNNIPKPMVEINGKPFLEYQLQLLKQNKITEILLCVGYLKDTITGYFGDGRKLGMRIEYSVEEGFLGTAGALKEARSLLPQEFILLYGDSYLPINYIELAEAWTGSKASGLVVCYNNSLGIARNNIYLNPENRVMAYDKRNPPVQANYVEAGVSILKKEILGLIPEGRVVSLEEEVFALLIKEQRLKGYPVSQRYYDIGTLERLEEIKGILR